MFLRSFLFLAYCVYSGLAFAPPIHEVFDHAGFEIGDNIPLRSQKIAGMDGHVVEKYPTGSNQSHYNERAQGEGVDFLIMHYTVGDFPSTIRHFTSDVSSGRASANYVISEHDPLRSMSGGRIVQVVPEDKRAWHAGISQWGESVNLNGTSVGVEHVNKGFLDHEGKPREWFSFDPAQIEATGRLSADIVRRHGILPQRVLGHADISPGRKHDPGILFPWGELYRTYGVGAWLEDRELRPGFIETQYLPKEPLPGGVSREFLLTYLEQYGYDCTHPDEAIRAFKMHYSHNQREECATSHVDRLAMQWAWGLQGKYNQLRH